MSIKDLWFGKRTAQQAPAADAAADGAAASKAPAPVADDARHEAVDSPAISADQGQDQTDDKELPAELTTDPSTGNPEVDALLKAKQAELVAAFHRSLQKQQDKLKASSPTDKNTEGDEETGQSTQRSKPIDLPRDLYRKHFATVGKFEDGNAEGLANSVADVALDVLTRVGMPELQAIREELAELRAVKQQHVDSEWDKVSALFPGSDEFKDEALRVSKAKKISLKAALVEVSDGSVVARQRVASERQKTAARPNSLRTATPAAQVNGGQPSMSRADLEAAFRNHIRQQAEALRNK